MRGHLIHLESLLETGDEHQTTSHGDLPDTTPGDRRDNMDTPLTETRPSYSPDQNPPWHTRTIATPTTAPSVISPAHYLDIETYTDAVHRDNNTECMSTFSNLAPATLSPAPHLSLLILSETHVNMLFPGDSIGNALSPSSPFYSWMIFNRLDCFDGPLTNSIVSYRDLGTQNRPDLRLAYKPKFWARVSSPGCPPYIMEISSEWFRAARAHPSSPAHGRSALHVLSEHVQPILNSGGHAPANWTVPSDWQFEILTKQIEQVATPPAPRGKFQPLSHNNRPHFDGSTTTFRRYQRDFDLSTERRLNALSRTAQNTKHTLPAWIQAQYDELNAPRPPPTPWVPFRWGSVSESRQYAYGSYVAYSKTQSQIYPTSYPCPFTGTSEHKEERWRYKEKQK